ARVLDDGRRPPLQAAALSEYRGRDASAGTLRRTHRSGLAHQGASRWRGYWQCAERPPGAAAELPLLRAVHPSAGLLRRRAVVRRTTARCSREARRRRARAAARWESQTASAGPDTGLPVEDR